MGACTYDTSGPLPTLPSSALASSGLVFIVFLIVPQRGSPSPAAHCVAPVVGAQTILPWC